MIVRRLLLLVLPLLTLPLCVAVGAAPAPARADLPPPGLTIGTAEASYRSGEVAALRATLTNSSDRPCQVAALSDGALTVTSLIRDDTPISPLPTRSYYTGGYDGAVRAQLRTLAPGGMVTFPITVVAGNVPVSYPMPGDGAAVTSMWPIGADGAYRMSFVYAPPALPVDDAVLCPMTGAADVSFRVGGRDAPPTQLWWVAGAVLGLLLLALLVLLGGWLRRQRRRRRHHGHGNGARVVAGAVLTLLAVSLAVLPGAAPAEARWEIVNGNEAFDKVVNDCFASYYLPGHDPAGIIGAINDPASPLVTIQPQISQQGHRTFDNSGGPNGKGSSAILFNHNVDFVHIDDGDWDACSDLYHELFHAYEYLKDTSNSQRCGNTGIQTDEVEAVFAENAYLKAHKRAPRTTYNRKKLPKSLDDCRKKPNPPKRKGPATRCKGYQDSCAATNGDPHLTTFDQHNYDFQAVGEFVAVRAATGDLEVQVRQAPVPHSRLASLNSAVALKVGPDRLGFYQTDGAVSVRLNGTTLDLSDRPSPLAGGGAVTRREADMHLGGHGYTVDWPDGSAAWLDPIGGWGLRLYLQLAPDRRGKVAGLLGNFDGDPENDLRGSDGETLPPDPDHAQLYRTFGDDWAVTAATSLFDYEPGTDPETFADPTFPDRAVTVADLPENVRTAARTTCEFVGVSGPALLDACVLDVVLTGQPAFAVAAGASQGIGAAGNPPTGTDPAGSGGTPPAAGGRTVTPGDVLRDGDTASGELAGPGQVVRFPLELGDATVVRLYEVPDNVRVSMVGPSPGGTDDLPGFTVTSPYQWMVRPGASYQLEVSYPEGVTTGGEFGFRLVTAKERRLTAKVGDQVGGRLDVPGRVDLYRLSVDADTRVALSGGGPCEDIALAIVDDEPSPHVYSPYSPCFAETLATLTAGRPYLLIVWSQAGRTGDYHFGIESLP
ncbi:VWD domain-containing protein [Plantactinospora solaniradicis]|uniref:VWD domain-containing protein n=1 Tax=Plantactinospora solaniradicis TaxID=1723736 RepID=A0ABW1KHZ3_9ACTN